MYTCCTTVVQKVLLVAWGAVVHGPVPFFACALMQLLKKNHFFLKKILPELKIVLPLQCTS